jgi:hypothetical protein
MAALGAGASGIDAVGVVSTGGEIFFLKKLNMCGGF